MTNHSTRPAPPEYCAGEFFVGTIGFDLYLALFATTAALKPPLVPTEIGKLLENAA